MGVGIVIPGILRFSTDFWKTVHPVHQIKYSQIELRLGLTELPKKESGLIYCYL